MNEEPRGNWYLLTGLILGLALGLVLSLLVYPVRYSDTDPSALSENYRSEYRRLIADAYSADANLARARARLELLRDDDPARALAAQAQRVLAAGGGPDDARSLALLAAALNGSLQPTAEPSPSATLEPGAATLTPDLFASTETPSPEPSGTLDASLGVLTPTPQTPTVTPRPTFTPRPSATPPRVLEAPFTLAKQSDVCDSSLAPGLIVVEVRESAGSPLPGVRVQVAWEGGQDTFYTGLSPEISPGYADFRMVQGISYTLRVGDAGVPVSAITLPACGGSKKFEFQEGAH